MTEYLFISMFVFLFFSQIFVSPFSVPNLSKVYLIFLLLYWSFFCYFLPHLLPNSSSSGLFAFNLFFPLSILTSSSVTSMYVALNLIDQFFSHHQNSISAFKKNRLHLLYLWLFNIVLSDNIFQLSAAWNNTAPFFLSLYIGNSKWEPVLKRKKKCDEHYKKNVNHFLSSQ